MTVSAQHKQEARTRRHRRVRKKVQGTAERPRLAVFRSNKHITAQVIDDRAGKTLAAASTTEADLRGSATGNKDAATKVGQLVADPRAGVVDLLLCEIAHDDRHLEAAQEEQGELARHETRADDADLLDASRLGVR